MTPESRPDGSDPGEVAAFISVFLVVVFALGSIIVIFLAVARTKGGLGSGPYIDWGAIGSLAAVAGTVANAALVAGLYFVVQEAREHRREAAETARVVRIQHMPYLRVDIAFAEFHETHLRLPKTRYVYTPEDLNLSHAFDGLNRTIGAGPEQDGLSLRLYVQNLHSEPLAIANDVILRLGVRWRIKETGSENLEIDVRYIAPGQTFCIELLRVSLTVAELAVSLTGLSYCDITGGVNVGGHGAIDMVYAVEDGQTATVTNQRGTLRGASRGAEITARVD